MKMKTYELTAAAALAAISAALQVAHIGYVSPWGIWIDLVAVSWMVAYFMYGGRTALMVSATGALIITLIAPSTWLGASMKWLGTLPMFLIPVVMEKTLKIKPGDFGNLKYLVAAVAVAILLRGIIVLPANYYYAIPIWTGMTTAEAFAAIPWWAVFGLNAVQGILETAIAWILVFRFRLERFSSWR